jgi:hypothetical protein
MSSISLAGYLDPGTGSVILQAILGGVAAAAVTAKLCWHRVTSIFRRNSDRPGAESPGSDQA